MAAEGEKERPHTAMGGESLGELDEAPNATPVMQVRTGHCVLPSAALVSGVTLPFPE